MAYGHAERNLAIIRQLEAETRHLLDSPPQLDHEQPACRKTRAAKAVGRQRQESRQRQSSCPAG